MRTIKNGFTVLAALVLANLALFAADKAPGKGKPALMTADTVVWAGLDFTLARMVGPNDFHDPAAIFPGFLDAWNGLVLTERLPFMEKELKRKVVVDIAGVTERNKAATGKQIHATPGPADSIEQTHITPQDIAGVVRALKLESKSGLGLVFVVDRFVKMPKGSGAVYVVFFDVGTREVIASDRMVKPASGFGFRNYWFGVIKRVEADLSKYR